MSEQPTSNLGDGNRYHGNHQLSPETWNSSPLNMLGWNQYIFRGQVIGGFHMHKVSPRLIPFVLPQAFMMKPIPHSQFSLESQENLISGQMKVYSSLDV
jgi:hypothetical protein